MKALFSLSPEPRLVEARRFEGLDVVIVVDRHRDGSVLDEFRGRLVAVATSNVGSSSLAVLKEPGFHPRAWSLATIRSIELDR